ncbi:zinc finger protein 761-like [Centruroides sculpturatus]|uniref:zinc finger protein 761-like n=1 Tax=Centruroides sculpturatus TaxID=218467 RepID=UPI000C6E7133|nr:zinc finger protein 761-like [Centruroides sculpturatus]
MSTQVRPRKNAHPRRLQVRKPQEIEKMADKNDNSLTCEECGKNFVRKKNLLSHKKTHSNERPHKCVECGQTFSLRNTLVCHRRVHTKERLYTCSLCFKSFTQCSTLKTHVIYKHTKSFPYFCDKCGRGFISPGKKVDHYSRKLCHKNEMTCDSN